METTSSAELRIRIAKYRAMARLTTDQETAQRIHQLADEREARILEIGFPTDEPSCGPN